MRHIIFCVKGSIHDNIVPNKYNGVFHKWIVSASNPTYVIIEDKQGIIHTLTTDQFKFRV